MKLDHISSKAVILRVKNIFVHHGIPETVHTDGGTQFTAEESQQFEKEYGFTHVTSSSKFPQSNGEAESPVKIAQRILSKEMDPNLGATLLESSFSPAELLYGWKLRTTLPQASCSLQPHWNPLSLQQFRTCNLHIKERYRRNYDARHGVHELDPLHPGAQVWIPDLSRYGRVLQPANQFRSYIVAVGTRDVRRNRTQLVTVWEIEADERMRRPAQGKTTGVVCPMSHTNCSGQLNRSRSLLNQEAKRQLLSRGCKLHRGHTRQALQKKNLEDSRKSKDQG
ncbi:hypothetical protein PR048_009462 [Dryococelus australis]|uniref:Integrase catalytic domain-containing protein n=1 Tax=Dryococelus australis TaxID=614101 RepID=A0ABQ9I0C7_9NEOP|nr:hypothetical protein PR048_009462 [Dryococelus australis]